MSDFDHDDAVEEDDQGETDEAQSMSMARRAVIRIRHPRPPSSNPEASVLAEESFSLRPDADSRPLWISADGRIFLETFNSLYSLAQDFLIAIAEPISRPSYIHEYMMTPPSLYAAASVGLDAESLLSTLARLSKTTPLPASLVAFVRSCTLRVGKVKLVLQHNLYWVETNSPDTLQLLLKDPVIQEARKGRAQSITQSSIKTGTDSTWMEDEDEEHGSEGDGSSKTASLATEKSIYSFEISPSLVESVKKRCIELDYPMLEEYDFRLDLRNPTLAISLKPSTTIRSYQEKCLAKMFGASRARSGLIVLPCGAGKTLVGITAATTIKKSTLVLCTSAVAVEQWRQSFKYFTNVADDTIARFTSESKERFPASTAGILVSTYTMVAYGGRRSSDSASLMSLIRDTEWGLLILDEVHVVPAHVFRRVLSVVAAHTKLGLTATLVREDEKIGDLNFLIGPKLYEANWMDLAKQGHIANVQCAEVWCPMTAEFYREYLSEESSRKRRLLYAMNPTKFQSCQYLIQYHEARGDKIIVFSDNVYALKAYALKLKKPFIYGPTSQLERMRILHQFQSNPNLNTIFLSKVGDTSIDLPEATCLIQISSHYGSRRQEAQRLGRILRAKRRNDEGFNAFFYSLVSKDTEEMYYSSKRQQFLIDQGYTFKVITELAGMPSLADLCYATQKEQLELLKSLLVATTAEVEEEDAVEPADDDIESVESSSTLSAAPPRSFNLPATPATTTTMKRSLASLSGSEAMAYIEYAKPVSVAKKPRHALFKALYKK